MATFPALIPSSRTFTPGEYLHSPFAGWSGQENRTRHSSVMINSQLRVGFIGLTSEQVVAAIDHYNGQTGSYVIFDLPAEVWSGTSDFNDYTLTGYFWRYIAAPVIEDLPCGRYNLSIELESAAPQSNVASARQWIVDISWLPGLAIGLDTNAALALGVNWLALAQWIQLTPDVETPSAALSVTATWTPGAAEEVVAPDVFNAVLYTGNGSTQSITGVGFEPNFVWIKNRSTGNHVFFDQARGATKYWRTFNIGTEITNANTLTSFDADGFGVGNSSVVNGNSANYVAYCIEEGASSSTNNDGTIQTTVYPSAGGVMSIMTYTGTGASASIGHGLGVAPDLVIIKDLTSGFADYFGSTVIGNNNYLSLSGDSAASTSSNLFQSYTSSVVNIGNSGLVNGSGASCVAYAFASIAGTSKIGGYTGGGATPVTVNCGFEPQFVLIKAHSTTGSPLIFDSVRGVTKQFTTDSNAGETTVDKITFSSTGFTVKANENTNTSSVDYLYMAFK